MFATLVHLPSIRENMVPAEDRVGEVISGLDDEQVQEQRPADETYSLLGVDAEAFREREREYRDIEKHWVRVQGWLAVAKMISENRAKMGLSQRLRYLTLPAYYRLDVSLLLREDLLEVTSTFEDGSAHEVYVAAFETDPTKFGRMQGQEPRFTLLGRTPIENALVDPKNDYYHQLRELFPFDIVNLDLTSSLTPIHEGPYSRTLRAIEEVLSLQAGIGTPWALFITFRNLPAEWEPEATRQLFSNLQSNLDTHPPVAEAFHSRYQRFTVTQLAEHDNRVCISQAVAKWITDRAHHHRFDVAQYKYYMYTRYNEGLPPYDIYKHLFVLNPGALHPGTIPTKGIPAQGWMIKNLVNCIERHHPKNVEDALLVIEENGRPIMETIRQDIDELCKQIT